MCGAGMRYTILLVCADKMLLDTRSLVLEIAGYRTLRASTLMSGLGLTFCCNLVVIDTTYSDDQQEEFLARLHNKNPNISLLRLDTRVTALESLVETVGKHCLLGHPLAGNRTINPVAAPSCVSPFGCLLRQYCDVATRISPATDGTDTGTSPKFRRINSRPPSPSLS